MNTIMFALASTVAGIGLSVSLPALAQEPTPPQSFGRQWSPIDPARLLDMRGGMQMPSGLMLSFGIERVAYVNGQLVAKASVHIADVSRISTEQAHALQAIKEGNVVQIGDGNQFNAAGMGNALVIQNSLDGQEIKAVTTLDIGVGTLGLLQEMNTYDALQNAQVSTPGGP